MDPGASICLELSFNEFCEKVTNGELKRRIGVIVNSLRARRSNTQSNFFENGVNLSDLFVRQASLVNRVNKTSRKCKILAREDFRSADLDFCGLKALAFYPNLNGLDPDCYDWIALFNTVPGQTSFKVSVTTHPYLSAPHNSPDTSFHRSKIADWRESLRGSELCFQDQEMILKMLKILDKLDGINLRTGYLTHLSPDQPTFMHLNSGEIALGIDGLRHLNRLEMLRLKESVGSRFKNAIICFEDTLSEDSLDRKGCLYIILKKEDGRKRTNPFYLQPKKKKIKSEKKFMPMA